MRSESHIVCAKPEQSASSARMGIGLSTPESVVSLFVVASSNPITRLMRRIAAMDIRSARVACGQQLRFAGALALLVLGFAASASSQQTAGTRPSRPECRPTRRTSPSRPKASLGKGRSLSRQRGPRLDSPAEVRHLPHQLSLHGGTASPRESRRRPRWLRSASFFEDRVAHWDDADQARQAAMGRRSRLDGRSPRDERLGHERQASSPYAAGTRPRLEGSETRWRLRLAQVRLATL